MFRAKSHIKTVRITCTEKKIKFFSYQKKSKIKIYLFKNDLQKIFLFRFGVFFVHHFRRPRPKLAPELPQIANQP